MTTDSVSDERLAELISYYNPPGSRWDRDTLAALRELATLRAAPPVAAEGWISVAEKLPDWHTEVLWVQANGRMEVTGITKDTRIDWYTYTHWMPLPSAPKEPK